MSEALDSKSPGIPKQNKSFKSRILARVPHVTRKAPIRDASQTRFEIEEESIERRVRKNVKFSWSVETDDTWGGLDKDTLCSLAGKVAEAVHIQPDQAEKIHVVFGNHAGLPRIVPFSAACYPVIGRNQTIDSCFIIINRSKEVWENHNLIGEEENKNKFKAIPGINQVTNETRLEYRIESPQELIIKIISEEMAHARHFLIAKTFEQVDAQENRYQAFLIGKNIPVNDAYQTDISEVAAARTDLQVLAKLLEATNPKRSAYFREIFRESLKQRKFPIWDASDEVINAIFIPTGFDQNGDNSEVVRLTS